MKEGLYKVDFATPAGAGSGVAYLKDGKLRGGDSMIAYVGTYSLEGDKITATVKTQAHSNVPGMASVFGLNNVEITIVGNVADNKIVTKGTAKEVPGVQFQANLALISE